MLVLLKFCVPVLFTFALAVARVHHSRSPHLKIKMGECGDVITLICSGGGTINHKTKYSWYKDYVPIYYHTNRRELLDDKYKGEIQNGNLVLKIHATRNSDAGLYKCSSNHRTSRSKEIHQLCVPILKSTCDNGVSKLTCSFQDEKINSCTNKTFSWFRNNINFLYDHEDYSTKYGCLTRNGDLVLEIFNINDSDMGQYSCDYNHLRSKAVTLERCYKHGGFDFQQEASSINIVRPRLSLIFINCIMLGMPQIIGFF